MLDFDYASLNMLRVFKHEAGTRYLRQWVVLGELSNCTTRLP